MPSPGTVIVSGSEGYLGRAVVRRLRHTDHVVLTVDKRARCDGRSGHVQCDLAVRGDTGRLEAELRHRIRGEAVVVHLAALFVKDFAARAEVSRDEYRRDNVQATQVLLDTMKAVGHPWRLVFTSTAFLYHHSDSRSPTGLDDYAASKLEAERLVAACPVPSAILRPVRIIGLSDQAPPATRGAPLALREGFRRALERERIPIDIVSTLMLSALESGTMHIDATGIRRSYLHVEDLARAVEVCVDAEVGHPGCHDLSTSAPVSLEAVAEGVAEVLEGVGIASRSCVHAAAGADVVEAGPGGLSGWQPHCDPSAAVVRRAAEQYVRVSLKSAGGMRG